MKYMKGWTGRGETNAITVHKWKKPGGNLGVVSSEAGIRGLVARRYGATCLMVLNVHKHKHMNAPHVKTYCIVHRACSISTAGFSNSHTHTRWPPGCCVFGATVCTAKSHSLSCREVQKPRGRWYVTESRLCVNASGWRSQSGCLVIEKVCACVH